MNKYIKTDIEQGLQYLKLGIMNALADIESGEVDEIELGDFIPFSLVRKCAEERGYQQIDFDINGQECNCWLYMQRSNQKAICIEGNLWYGTSKIYIADKYV